MQSVWRWMIRASRHCLLKNSVKGVGIKMSTQELKNGLTRVGFDAVASYYFSIETTQHRVLGKQIRLQLADDLLLLTPGEASSLSFALVAVREGVSQEREIYMSPIASDVAFVGTVHETGMRIAITNGTLDLDWSSVGMLAEKLATAI
jgi:hypothetical protein